MNEFHSGDRVMYLNKLWIVLEETEHGVILASGGKVVTAQRQSITASTLPPLRADASAEPNRASHEF